MNIEIIPCLNDNYSYLIHDVNSNTVAIVDPSEFGPCDRIISKNLKKLDFILNTHHHHDHIGGNEELKKKYNSKILGFKKDKNRIPGIDIELEDNQKFRVGNLNFETIFIPGHTSGHIAFYLKKEKIVFTGDTLFSLGCGRVFEGTHEEMFHSLIKLACLPSDTKVYCGHEYTRKNLEFCLKYEPNNEMLKKKKDWINLRIKSGLPTIPFSIKDELSTNIFLRCKEQEVKNALNLNNAPEQEIFAKLRDLKDNF